MVVHVEPMIGLLEEKATSEAYKALRELEKISDEKGLTYCYIDKFIDMISSDKYAIWVRGFLLFCRQAKWDIVRYKPDLREVVKKSVWDIDYLQYKKTMHSLLAKDIDMVLSLIRELEH